MKSARHSHVDSRHVNHPLAEALAYLECLERDDLPGRFSAHGPVVVQRF